ncbi:hypothetical protein PG996_014272 [Apiospora saccharicola]|uniref:protein-ribulosamine 3-kinase n=1 Tax=Apiospora saccharicola TaxID=335842 RepID=A0ABR1THV2_9PEZI
MSAGSIAKGVAEAEEIDPLGPNVVLDRSLMAAFPEGSNVLEVTPSGVSAWVKTVKIDIQLPDGTVKSYFKKGAPGHRGLGMMEGTYMSEKLIHSFIPEHVPAPLAFGSYESLPNMHYYICDYGDMTDDLPDPARFGQTFAKLHLNSMGKSPTGRYGFPLTTHLAFVPNDNTWTDTWSEWFSNAMKKMLEEEERSHGQDDKLDQLKEPLFAKVIPGLLRPMETGSNRIEPCLCHSDVWPGNIKPNANNGEVMMLDSCAFWGHHECTKPTSISMSELKDDSNHQMTNLADLGCCRAPRYGMGRAYVEEYFKCIPPSKPEEDFEDRLALYAMRYDLLHSALFPKEPQFRATAMVEMQRLVDKYPEGFQEPAVR